MKRARIAFPFGRRSGAAPLEKKPYGVHVLQTMNPMPLHAMLQRKGPDSFSSRVS
jgi:hypothetical protein